MFCSKIFLVLLLGFFYFHVKRCVTNINQEEPWPKDKEELDMLPEKQQKLARWACYLQRFSFTIEYRKGSKHANVDALSRPVLAAKAITNHQEPDFSSKNLDPIEDALLIYYLQFKKLKSGCSRKQSNRVRSLAKNYEWKQDKLYFKERSEDIFKQPQIRLL